MQREKYYKMSTKQTLEKLNSSKEGLLDQEVEHRRIEAKRYQLKPEKRQSFIVKFLYQLKDIMVLILLISGVVSIVIGLCQNSMTEIVDGAIILGIVVMNALFGVFQERKSERAVDALK